jgi:SAM-dependent methyltransferase
MTTEEHEHNARVREQFRLQAATFTDTGFAANNLDWIVAQLAPGADEHALDVACGAGHLGRALAPYVSHVSALDLTPEMLAQGDQLARRAGLRNISFAVGDATALPWLEAQFDLVVCRIALHQVADRRCGRSLDGPGDPTRRPDRHYRHRARRAGPAGRPSDRSCPGPEREIDAGYEAIETAGLMAATLPLGTRSSGVGSCLQLLHVVLLGKTGMPSTIHLAFIGGQRTLIILLRFVGLGNGGVARGCDGTGRISGGGGQENRATDCGRANEHVY